MRTLFTLIMAVVAFIDAQRLPAQSRSARSNAVYIDGTSTTDPVLRLPVVKWLAPGQGTTIVKVDSLDVVVSVASTVLLKSVEVHVRNREGESTCILVPSGPGNGNQKTFTNKVGLLDGLNTLELVVENAGGIKVSAKRFVERPANAGPYAPPMLIVKENSVSFTDAGGNGRLDALEEAVIRFTVANSGRGDAKGLTLRGATDGNQDIQIGDVVTADIVMGAEQEFTAHIRAGDSLATGKSLITFVIVEPNGFDSEPIVIGFETGPFEAPSVIVGDGVFTSIYAGKLKRNMPASLSILVENQGAGDADDVVLTIALPENVLNLGDANVTLGQMKPGASTKLDLEFVANARYQPADVPIRLTLTEKFGKYGSERTFVATMDQPLGTMQVNVKSAAAMAPVAGPAFLRSAVDINVPVNTAKYPNRYALVVGNEDYSQFQPGLNREQNVAFARNDARVFRDYLVNTLGCPENQVYVLFDATKGQLNRELERLKELVKLQPGSEIIFYYAGHGLPDFETRKGYLIPVDVSGANIKDGIGLSDLYAQLVSTNAARVTVFLDACFSGGGRGENGLLAARTVKIKPTGDVVEGNIIVYTATSGEEASLPIKRESHGLFTYYLLKKINETKGDVTMKELKEYLEVEIPKASLIENGVRQTPQVLTSPKLESDWAVWKF